MSGRILLVFLLVLASCCCLGVLASSSLAKCTEETPGNNDLDESIRGGRGGGGCMNGGVCKNGTCVCKDGWQGSECQFCGGKVR